MLLRPPLVMFLEHRFFRAITCRLLKKHEIQQFKVTKEVAVGLIISASFRMFQHGRL